MAKAIIITEDINGKDSDAGKECPRPKSGVSAEAEGRKMGDLF